VEVRKLPATWFDRLVAQQERQLLRLDRDIRMVQDVHDRSDNLLFILYALRDRCLEMEFCLKNWCRDREMTGESASGIVTGIPLETAEEGNPLPAIAVNGFPIRL
jgi:hypothetical protein